MFRRLADTAAALWILASAQFLSAQAPAPTPAPADDIQVVIKGGGERRLAVAVPPLYAPGTAALQAKVVEPFTATLRSDLEYAGAFSVTDPAHYPSATEYRDLLSQLQGMPAVLADLGVGESPAGIASGIEFVLEGLHLTKRLNKDAVGTRATFRARG